MGGEIYWPNKGRFPYLVNIFFIWLPPAKFWQRIIKTVWIPTIFAGGNVIPYLVNIFVPPLSDPLYGQYIIPPSLLWSIYHPLMTVIYFIPILVNILIDFIIFCNMIVQAESLSTTRCYILVATCPCGSLSIRDVLPLELFTCLWMVSPQVQGSVSSATLLLLYVNYSCIQADTLKMHMVMHSGEKSFKCKQCNNSCTNAGGLKRHILVHTGEKPFSCNQCKYSCAVAGSMKMHMLVHTRERPLKC